MGDTGPCGPCSEIYYDRGPEFGRRRRPGGAATESGSSSSGTWSSCSTTARPTARCSTCPTSNIDTGAGLERMLSILQGVDSNWDTDVLRPLIAEAEAVTGRTYGADPEVDVALRILADHARSMTFLVNDGVFPSNEDRGYVLRRLIRRAVRQAYQLGVDAAGHAPPGARPSSRSWPRPTRTCAATRTSSPAWWPGRRSGSGPRCAPGWHARRRAGRRRHVVSGRGGVQAPRHPRLPDRADPGDRGRARRRGRRGRLRRRPWPSRSSSPSGAARRTPADGAHADAYRELLEQFGTTEFVGYTDDEATAGCWPSSPSTARGRPTGRQVEIFLDRTPFYAEAGGQVGDTGSIETDDRSGRGASTPPRPCPACTGTWPGGPTATITPGQEAHAAIDVDRRDAIRRNHTGTHLLHWALREVLGDHVKQAGSLVAPDRLRFDFSHYSPVTPDADRRDRGPGQRPDPGRRAGRRRPRCRRRRPSGSAPSPSSATSTATWSGWSRPEPGRWSCAAAPTCRPWA